MATAIDSRSSAVEAAVAEIMEAAAEALASMGSREDEEDYRGPEYRKYVDKVDRALHDNFDIAIFNMGDMLTLARAVLWVYGYRYYSRHDCFGRAAAENKLRFFLNMASAAAYKAHEEYCKEWGIRI